MHVVESPYRRQSSGVKVARPYMALACSYCFFCPWVFLPVTNTIYITAVDALFIPLILVFLARPRLTLSWPGIFALVYLSFVLIQSVFSPYSSLDSMKFLRVVFIYSPLLFSLLAFRLSSRDFSIIVLWSWLGLSVSVTIGITLHSLGIQLRSAQQELWVQGGQSALRLAGITGNTAEFGHITATWFLLTLFFGESLFGRWRNYIRSVATLGFGYLIIFSSSRAALLDVFVAVSTYFLVASFKNSAGVFRLVATALLSISLYLALLFGLRGFSPVVDASLMRIDFFGIAYTNLNDFSDTRLFTWLKVINDQEIGVFQGLGWKSGTVRYGDAIDNTYLSNYADLGAIGLITFLLLWFSLFRSIQRSACVSSQRAALYSLLVGSSAHAATMDLHTMWASTPVIFTIAIAAARVRVSPEQPHLSGPN